MSHPMRRSTDKPSDKVWLTQKIGVPRWIVMVVFVMLVCTSGLQYWQAGEQQKCNQVFVSNLGVRSTWAAQDRRAEHKKDKRAFEFWSYVREHPTDREGNRQKFDAWLDSFKHSNQVFHRNSIRRAKQDLPDLASCD